MTLRIVRRPENEKWGETSNGCDIKILYYLEEDHLRLSDVNDVMLATRHENPFLYKWRIIGPPVCDQHDVMVIYSTDMKDADLSNQELMNIVKRYISDDPQR